MGGMSYKLNMNAHIPATSINQVGNLHSPSTNMGTSATSYRTIISDCGQSSLGCAQGTTTTTTTAIPTASPATPSSSSSSSSSSSNQAPQSKYAELLNIIEELGKEIRPTYAGSKSAMERLKRGIIHARGLVRECLAETERNARS